MRKRDWIILAQEQAARYVSANTILRRAVCSDLAHAQRNSIEGKELHGKQ